MSESSFRYVGSAGAAARLRRLLIAGLLAVMAALALDAALYGIDQRWPGFDEYVVNIVAKKLDWAPTVDWRIPWGWPPIALLAGVGTLALLKSEVPAKLDFFLFSAFDVESFDPLSPQTGILEWQLPDEGPLRAAWIRLLGEGEQEGWVGIGNDRGRWDLSWVINRPKLERPFDWMVLLGGNGTGKSQLARELGRNLARADEFDDDGSEGAERWRRRWTLRRRRFVCWLQRAVWWLEMRDPPWDVGLIKKDKGKANFSPLAQWLPRMPTLLILDDPGIGECSNLIELLEKSKDAFWFPVRLLVVDQFMPADLPVTANSEFDHPGWHYDRTDIPFVPIYLGEVALDLASFRRITYFWSVGAGSLARRVPTASVRALGLRDDALERLLAAVEGNPLLLALAVLWLAADEGRSVGELLRTDLSSSEENLFMEAFPGLKELVAHRLISDRVEELFEDYRRIEERNGLALGNLRRAIACATVGDGLSRKAAETAFGLTCDAQALRRWFPGAPARLERIPPLRPWPVGAAFFRKVEHSLLHEESARVKALITEAFKDNPAGVLKSLSRSGGLAGTIAAMLDSLPWPDDADRLLDLFEAYARHALCNRRALLDRAERVLVTLGSGAAIDEAGRRLDRLLESLPHPDLVGGLVLTCRLGVCRLERSGSDSDVDAIWQGLAHLIEMADLNDALSGHENDDLLNAWNAVWPPLFAALIEKSTDPIRLLLAIDIRYAPYCTVRMLQGWSRSIASLPLGSKYPTQLFASAWMVQVLAARNASWFAAERQSAWDEAERIARAWQAGSREDDLDDCSKAAAWWLLTMGIAPSDNGIAQIEHAVVELEKLADLHADDSRIKLFLGRALLACLQRHTDLRWAVDRLREAASQIERLAQVEKDDELWQILQMQAWTCVSRAARLAPDALFVAQDIAQRIEPLVAASPSNVLVQQCAAGLWSDIASLLGESRSSDEREMAEVVDRVEATASRFARYAGIQAAKNRAWHWQARQYSNLAKFGQVEIAVSRIEATASAFPEHYGVQLARCMAWGELAFARSRDPINIREPEDACRRAEAVAMPYPHSEAMHFWVARAWGWVADQYLTSARPVAAVVRIAEHVDFILRNFSSPRCLEERARNWQRVVFAYADRLSYCEEMSDAASRVDDIFAAAPDDEVLAELCAVSWFSLIETASNGAANRVVAESAWRRIEEIAKACPANQVVSRVVSQAGTLIQPMRTVSTHQD